MSGGSYNYAYGRVEDMARSMRHVGESPLRRAFANHLRLVADAMHAIEWVDSGDYGSGDEDGPIRKVLASGVELVAAIEMAEQARAALDQAIEGAKRSSLTSSTPKEGT